jgi:type II secretory pathway pseudopilin PulG
MVFKDRTIVWIQTASVAPVSGLPGGRKGPQRDVRLRAFSAIELTGVLAIIALLAATILPNVIRRIDRATWQRETSDLNAMAKGLTESILRDKQIPAQANIPDAIRKYLDLSFSQVTTTPRGFSRGFLVDPGLVINGGALPYVQGNSGASARPANTRVIILSTIASPAVTTISDSFATVWNTAEGAKPPSWSGKADDLCIQRVELGQLFHKLHLVNIDTNSTHFGYYRFETNGTMSVAPNGAQVNVYVLHGTALNLYAGGPTNLQIRVILNQDESFAYQNDRWTTDLGSDQIVETLGDFGTWVKKFLAAVPPCPNNWATPQAVIDQFYIYLYGYWVWAASNFEGVGSSSTVQDPFYRVASDGRVALNDFSNNLIH